MPNAEVHDYSDYFGGEPEFNSESGEQVVLGMSILSETKLVKCYAEQMNCSVHETQFQCSFCGSTFILFVKGPMYCMMHYSPELLYFIYEKRKIYH
jgi:hypothetical protein